MPAAPPPEPRPSSAEHLAAELLESARHELRTPLVIAHGHAQLLQRRLAGIDGLTDPERERLRRSVIAIEWACRELAAVIDRLDPRSPPAADTPDSDAAHEGRDRG